MTEKEIQEKARSCKYFYFTPLCTALICKKKDKELKSVLHGIEWDGKECENCGFYLEKGGKKMTAQQYVEQDHSQAYNDLRNVVNIAADTKSFKTLLNAVKKLCDAYEKMRVSQRTLPPDNIKRRNAERIFRLRMEKLLSLQKKQKNDKMEINNHSGHRAGCGGLCCGDFAVAAE